MVKFKKRVAKHKISRFFNTTPLVIFFHCGDTKDFFKQLSQSLNYNVVTTKIKKEQCLQSKPLEKENFDSAKIKHLVALEDLMIKTVKNNFAKKALLDLPHQMQEEQITDPSSVNKKALAKDFAQSSQQKINRDSLFQGKNILMGFHNINSLSKVKDFVEHKNVDVLGAIYQNKVIDHNQLKRLASICRDEQIYVNLINSLKSCGNHLINKVSNKLHFSYLLEPQCNVIVLLKALNHCKNN